MTIVVTVPPHPDILAVSSTLLKAHLNILSSEYDYDTVLAMYLPSAVDEFTSRTGKALINQTVRQVFDTFPCERFFLLERSPLVSFTSIQYYNTEGVLTTLPTSVYSYDGDSISPIIQLKKEQTWPETQCGKLNSVQVTYVVGYGVRETAIPMDIKRILSMLIGDSFLFRENTQALPGAGQIIVTPNSFAAMAKYKSNYYEHRSQSRRR